MKKRHKQTGKQTESQERCIHRISSNCAGKKKQYDIVRGYSFEKWSTDGIVLTAAATARAGRERQENLNRASMDKNVRS